MHRRGGPAVHCSYWVASSEGTDFPKLEGEVEADVAIVGAGLVGTTAALLLKRAGKRVILLETDRALHGVSGYTTAKLTSGHHLIYSRLESQHGEETARSYAQANQAALERIARMVEEEGIDCDFERKDNYIYCESSGGVEAIRKEAESARRAGLPASVVTRTHLPFPVAAAVRIPDQAQFHPLKYLLSLLHQLPGDGCHVFEKTRVTDLKEGPPHQVVSSSGKVLASHVILATNYPILDRSWLFPRIHPKRSYAIAAPFDRSHDPQGMFISANEPIRSLRTIDAGEERLLLVGGEGHAVGEAIDTGRCYTELERWARSHFELGDIAYRWSAQDGVSVDGLPYAGTYRRGSDSIFVITGFGKWGMTNGTAAAEIVSDAILGRHNCWARLLNPHRLTIFPSAKKLMAENAKVAEHWFGDRLRHPQTKRLADLAPGEAGVERRGLRTLAGYHDLDGKLHVVSAVCTHLGCTVIWNRAELSWDCPCHGSRFDTEGKVLQGPAVDDLATQTP